MSADVALAANDALLGQGVEMRGRDFLGVQRIEEHVGVTEVISDDHDDVGFGSGGGE